MTPAVRALRAVPAAEQHEAPLDIRPIAALSDPVGVLSVYADADMAAAESAWQSRLRAGLRRLVREARLARPRSEWVALEARLAELEPELETLLDPGLGRRGRALFAAVAGRALHRVELHAPLAPLVALDRQACVLPLVAALQEARPAGVAIVSWDRLEPAEWQDDALQPLEPIELADPDLRRPPTNPVGLQPSPERETLEGAAGARVATRLRDASARLLTQAQARGWDILVVDGDPPLVEALAASLENGAFRVLRSAGSLGDLAEAAAAERVGTMVREQRREQQAQLVRELEAASTSTRDPLMLERSLEEGRVEHLVVEVPAEPVWSPFPESLLRRAFQTGARVTAVPPGLGNLGPGGAAALLGR